MQPLNADLHRRAVNTIRARQKTKGTMGSPWIKRARNLLLVVVGGFFRDRR